jgi:hypothetical protein
LVTPIAVIRAILDRPACQCREHVANAAVVDLLRSSLAATVRTVGEHDRVEPFDGGRERLQDV